MVNQKEINTLNEQTRPKADYCELVQALSHDSDPDLGLNLAAALCQETQTQNQP